MHLSVTFSAMRGRSVFQEKDRIACQITMDERLAVQLWYDFSADPLVLEADASKGDLVRLIIRPYRIELYVNDALVDEEWPCGKAYLTPDSSAEGDFAPVLSELTPEIPEILPDCTRKNIKTPEIRLAGVNIGDCMPYSDVEGADGRYHLFYLYDRHHHKSKWWLGAHQWAHVSTVDFRTWEEHPMAIGITEDWEGSICTGSVCRAGEQWYAWYAVRMSDHSPARMTYAVSKDLIHFEKCGAYFHLPAGYEPTSARDPMVFCQDGEYHMLVTTTRLSDGSGCLAHLANDRMAIDGWEDRGAAVAWSELCPADDPNRLQQPECPDHFRIGAYYYLVFSIDGTARYGFSKEPYGGWVFPEDNCIPCGMVPKSAILPGTGRRIFMGFLREGGYAGSLCAAEVFQNPDGTLRFEALAL